MTSVNLQKAINALQIHDVYQRGSLAKCVNGFEPKYDKNIDKLETQTKHVVKQTQLARINEAQWLMRVFIELGARLIDPDIEQEEESVRAFIEAEYVAEYLMDEELDQNCIDEYALNNASFHVWPYWREFLMNQCSRMYLPRLVLPTRQFARNKDQRKMPQPEIQSDVD